MTDEPKANMENLKPLPKPVSMNQSRNHPKHKRQRSNKPSKPIKPTSKPTPMIRPERPERPITKVQAKVVERPRPVRKRRGFNAKRVAGLVLPLVILVGLVGFILLSGGGTNALALYIDEEHFAYINEDISEEELMAEVQRRLQHTQGAQVIINEEISLQPTNITNREEQIVLPPSEAVEQLISTVTFRIVGTAIYVSGNRKAILRNQAEVDEVERHLLQPFMRAGANYVDSGFVERFDMVSVTVNPEQISTVSEALRLLDGQIMVMEEYVVRSGDSLSRIAAVHGISQERLLANNPNFTPNTVLRIGDIMLIETSRPYLSVRTVEEVTRTEVISIEIQNRENPSRPSHSSEVIQQGRSGERQIVERIVRINGVEYSEEVISMDIISEMIPQIVEVGTMLASPSED